MRLRESVVQSIERAGRELHASGWKASFFADAHESVVAVASEANAHLIGVLAAAAEHADADVAELFRAGAAMYDDEDCTWNVDIRLFFSYA